MSIAAERFAAQLLTRRQATSPVEVVERLLAVQAQDLRGARLAIRARSRGLYASDVDRALAQRQLVVTTLNRGTLHLVRAADYWWLQALTTPQLARSGVHRLQQEGVPPADAERSVAVIVEAVSQGPQTRHQLRDRLAKAGLRVAGPALIHQIFFASLRGLIVRGPTVDGEHAFVLVRDWLGTPPAFDRDAALAELGRRYLVGHGPADHRDLARWAGITLADARRAMTGAGLLRKDGLLEAPDAEHVEAPPAPALLGAFEPVLLGWTSRADILGGDQTLVTSNGVFRPFALVDGVAAGAWGFARGKVSVRPFRRLPARVSRALADEAAAVEAFLGPRPGSE